MVIMQYGLQIKQSRDILIERGAINLKRRICCMKKRAVGLFLSTALLTSAIFSTQASAGEMSASLNIFKTANGLIPLGNTL